MKVKVTCLKQNEECRLIIDFCKWQGFTVTTELGPDMVPLIEFPIQPGLGIKGANHEIEVTRGFINFVQLATRYGLIR